MKKFYKEVSVGMRPPPDPAAPDRRYAVATDPRKGEVNLRGIFLDGKPIKTPMRATLALPTRGLAEAVAEEWRGQGENVLPKTMPLTKLANTAIDRVAGHESDVVEMIVAYANDHLCYRAEAPGGLAARQNASWNPLLDWAAQRYGARLRTGVGIAHIAQPEEAVAALRRAVAGREAFELAALHAATTLCGSLVLALALADGRLDAEEAFALSQLDERYQAEKWGADEEAAARAHGLAAELAAAERFMTLAMVK